MTGSYLSRLSEISKFLGQTMIFQGLSLEQLGDLANLAIPQTYRKGDTIFNQGDNGVGFFVVKSGRVKVLKLSAEGKEQILHIFSVGDHFAEVPALDGECFPASAAAIDPAEVLFFPRQAFLQLLEQRPTLAINMLRSFARHLRHFSHLIDSLVLSEVPTRLATYLLNLSEQSNQVEVVELDLTKGQLAARLGTIPETLSRVFAKLSREGLIQMEDTKIKLLDMEGLNQLAIGKNHH